jgi:hypothetical protein
MSFLHNSTQLSTKELIRTVMYQLLTWLYLCSPEKNLVPSASFPLLLVVCKRKGLQFNREATIYAVSTFPLVSFLSVSSQSASQENGSEYAHVYLSTSIDLKSTYHIQVKTVLSCLWMQLWMDRVWVGAWGYPACGIDFCFPSLTSFCIWVLTSADALVMSIGGKSQVA